MFRFQSDRLKTKQKLGSGRSGAVFPYQKDPQDFKWVVKRIRADDADALLSSLSEIVLGFSCDHPRVVPIKGYFIEPDSNKESFNVYMKLPRMEVTLMDEFKNRMKNNKSYSEEEIIRHFYSLTSGLEYLHNKRIYHGDIKPNNLLLDKNRTLHIADVGIAKHVEEGDEYQTVTEKIGTYQYTAPEIMGAERKDIKKDTLAKADIWSLGVIVLELCVFDLKLLNSLNREETRKRIEKHLESLEERFNNPLIALVKRILSSDPKERPDLTQIKDELERSFPEILSQDLLILGKAHVPVNIDNKYEDQIQVLNQQLKENFESFETERKHLKERISHFESHLSQQKQQYEQQIRILTNQNEMKARQERSQQETENRVLEERIRGLEQELQKQQKIRHLNDINILKEKENKLNANEQKIKALEQREQVVSETLEQEKKQFQRMISHLEQSIYQQKQQSEEKLKTMIEQNNMKTLNERKVLEQNVHALQEKIKGMERGEQKARDEAHRYLQEIDFQNEKIRSLQQQIQNSQKQSETYKQKNYKEKEPNIALNKYNIGFQKMTDAENLQEKESEGRKEDPEKLKEILSFYKDYLKYEGQRLGIVQKSPK